MPVWWIVNKTKKPGQAGISNIALYYRGGISRFDCTTWLYSNKIWPMNLLEYFLSHSWDSSSAELHVTECFLQESFRLLTGYITCWKSEYHWLIVLPDEYCFSYSILHHNEPVLKHILCVWTQVRYDGWSNRKNEWASSWMRFQEVAADLKRQVWVNGLQSLETNQDA